MRHLILFLLLPLAACDSTTVEEPEQPGLPRVVASAKAEFSSIRASSFTLSLDERGEAESSLGSFSRFDQNNPHVIDAAALWVSGMQAGRLRTAQTRSTNAPCGDGSGGVFHLFADTTYAAEGWPVTRGAPTNATGAPRVYGDEMLWSTTCQSPDNARGLTVFEGLQSTVALYRYANMPNTVFARYEIANTSALAMNDVSVGLFADPDLAINEGFDVYDNLVGLDKALDLGYVYFDQVITGGTANPAGTPRTTEQRGLVAGVTLLETPRGAGLTGHRIMRKTAPFQEPNVYQDLVYSLALQTMFNDGSAQTNWTTGLTDMFAYTGDPVAMTGWLDGTGPVRYGSEPADVQSGHDARLLLSSGSFTVAPGERVTLTAAWVVVSESSLGAGLGALKQRVSSLRATPALWTF